MSASISMIAEETSSAAAKGMLLPVSEDMILHAAYEDIMLAGAEEDTILAAALSFLFSVAGASLLPIGWGFLLPVGDTSSATAEDTS